MLEYKESARRVRSESSSGDAFTRAFGVAIAIVLAVALAVSVTVSFSVAVAFAVAVATLVTDHDPLTLNPRKKSTIANKQRVFPESLSPRMTRTL